MMKLSHLPLRVYLLFLAGCFSESTPQVELSGAEVYQKYCQSCHQVNGQGMAGLYPPLALSSWVQAEPSVPIRIVLHGLQGPIVVREQKYNNIMAAWGTILSSQDVARVLTYVRQSWGNKASTISTKQVDDIRAKYHRSTAWTVDTLQRR